MTVFEPEGGILCLVTDRGRCGLESEQARIDAVVAQVTEAAGAGIDLVQVRERGLAAAALAELVERCIRSVRGRRTRIVVNDRLDVALATRADGVHLPGDSLDPARVRALAPEGFVIGCSVHDRHEAIAAQATSAVDYLVFGTVFPSASKPVGHVCAGADALDRVAGAVRIPVLGIGGIDSETLPTVAATGAAGVAAIDFFAGRRRGAVGPGAVAAAVALARRVYEREPVRSGAIEWS